MYYIVHKQSRIEIN